MTALDIGADPAVATARAALAGARAWVVGGTIRDALLGRPIRDVDLALDGDARAAARSVARAAGGSAFSLSDQFGSWRAVGSGGGWVCDVSPLQGGSIESDLARRDFTANAMAVPLAGGELIDPHGGAGDLEAGLLRVVGPESYRADPLRPLRLVRLSAELGLQPEPGTERLTAEAAARVVESSPERVFVELRRLIACDRVIEGLELADRTGITAAVLPELDALHGVEQSQFHHLDVYDHTIEVLRRLLDAERDLPALFGADDAPRLEAVLAEPLADELTRGQALRLGALFHDVGKPPTRGLRPDGRVTFIGHDSVGREMVAEIFARLRASSRLRSFVAALADSHLVLGFLVHQRPLPPRAVYRYLVETAPVEVEVTLLSCADRLATRGRRAEPAIEAHLGLAAELMTAALAWRVAGGPPPLPIRGDELAGELGIEPGPRLGRLLAAVEEATYAGEVATRGQAVELARAELARGRLPGGEDGG